MSYHSTSSAAIQSATNDQGQTAPAGYHYMPDGTLMLDSEHDALYSEKTITSFEMDFSSLTALTETRAFTVSGDNGAVFNLEVRNEDSKYYNFITKLFQVAKAGLYNKVISRSSFEGNIVFPTVTDADQYDISLSAQPVTTRHTKYNEVRFGDGSLDINSTTGSNSLLITKVIYQYTTLTLTISPFSSNASIPGTAGNATIAVSAGKSLTDIQAFSTTFTVANDRALQIIKQPSVSDSFTTTGFTVGDPLTIPGENIYPTATAAFTGDDVNGAIVDGVVVRMDNTDLSAVIKVGDKITTPVTTDTVNGDFAGGAVAITMDAGVATKMAVGDRVTGTAVLDAGIFTVASIDSTNVFSLSAGAAIADGTTLTFSSKINRSLTTVTVVETEGTATDFTMSQAIQFRDNAPLTFFNQMNYRWTSDRVESLAAGYVVFDLTGNGLLIGSSTIADYSSTTTVFAGTEQEKTYVNKEVPAIETTGKPGILRGEVNVQAGNVVFSAQQELLLAQDDVKLGGYGRVNINKVSGYDVILTDLAVVLTEVSTTTTAAVINSTSIPVTSRNGILDSVSTVSGIGINPALANPTVSSGAGAVTGAGTIVLDAPQTIENGATLTFANTGLVATITGNAQVLKAGTYAASIGLDVNNFLSIT